MKSTLIVGIGASLLTAGIAKAQQRQDITPRTPNVLFIYADDLGYGDLECYDGTQVKTPNINRLAKNGIRFTNAHATASTSTPSRYSMLTGEYAWRRPGTDIAAGNAGMIIRPERYTIADMFKNAGYATAAIGKWHLGLGDKAGEQELERPTPHRPWRSGIGLFLYHGGDGKTAVPLRIHRERAGGELRSGRPDLCQLPAELSRRADRKR